MREIIAPPRRRHPGARTTFVIQRDGEVWSFGIPHTSFVNFRSRAEAVAHAEEIVRRIPDADFAVLDAD